MFSRKFSTFLLCFALLFFGLFALSSCTYHERFIIRIDEGQSNPCVGVVRFSFVIEALEGGQDPLTSERVTEDFLDQQLYWNPASGSCQMPDGILLKNIPYGGRRKITIQAFDSSGELVASGSSPEFLLEANGDQVQDIITMDLVRGCKEFDSASGACTVRNNVGLGTLIIRFPPQGLVPPGTSKIIFQLDKDATNNLQELTRRIQIQDAKLPEFLVLTNIPAAQNREYTLHALNTTNAQIREWSGKYTLKNNPLPNEATSRLIPVLKN